MQSNWRPAIVICSSLLLVASTACGGGATASSAPAQQRRVVTTAASPAASPVIVSAQSRQPVPSTQSSGGTSGLRTPSDGQQIVMVDSTDGEGVWVRRQPAGDPLRVWPDGSPMLVVGDDKRAAGRTWRNVMTLDGQTGWVAADFVQAADPAMLAAGIPNLNDLLAAAAAVAPVVNPDLQARVAVGDGAVAPTATAGQAGAATSPAQGASLTQTAPRPPAASLILNPTAPTPAAVPSAAAPTPQPTATALPTATPIKAPAGATSIDVGPTTMAVTGIDHGIPLTIGSRPRSGMELLAVQVRVTNHGDGPFALYRGSFRLALSDRSRLEPLAGGDDPIPYSAAVAPGDTLEGALIFEVPSGIRVDGLIWAPDRDVAYSLSVPV